MSLDQKLDDHFEKVLKSSVAVQDLSEKVVEDGANPHTLTVQLLTVLNHQVTVLNGIYGELVAARRGQAASKSVMVGASK